MMNLLKLPFLLLWRLLTLGMGSGKIRDTAGRINRYGDRFRNAGDKNKAHLSERYASIARYCFTAMGALAVEQEFLEMIGERKPAPAPVQDTRDWTDTTTSDRSDRWESRSSYSDSSSSTNSDSSNDREVSGSGGEFGGGGASGSWDSNTDNS